MLLKKDKYHYTMSIMAEDKKYYLNINDQNVGPLSFEDIVERLRSGSLSPEDQIFREGNENWVQIKDIDELAEYRSKISDGDMKIWFIRKNKENIGPVTKKEVLNLLHNEEVGADDYVWRKGLGNWVQIKDLYELKVTKDVAEEIENVDKKTLGDMPKQIDVEVPQRSLELIQAQSAEEKEMQKTQGQQTENNTPEAPKKPERTPRKLFPEFIFGIALMLLGGYQIDNNLIMGSTALIFGAVLVIAYFVSNRKKGTNDVPNK
jgi:hypothetical protein